MAGKHYSRSGEQQRAAAAKSTESKVVACEECGVVNHSIGCLLDASIRFTPANNAIPERIINKYIKLNCSNDTKVAFSVGAITSTNRAGSSLNVPELLQTIPAS